MVLSNDALAILLICSHAGLAEDSPFKPLTLREWNSLARKLAGAALCPGDLPGSSVSNLQSRLELAADEAQRIIILLARDEALSNALQRLAARNIYPITRMDPDYPSKFRERLKDAAPTVLFYAGEKALLGQPGIAVVGSRRLDPAGQECAEIVGNACGLSGRVLYSGGAKGVDTISMAAALEARGTAVGILANSLEDAIRGSEARIALRAGNLCLLTPYSPNAGFSVGAAMGRNRLIYTLADYAVVVASDAGTGGTWAGASEALKHGWVPVFVLEHEAMPEGNRQLLAKGALPLPYPIREKPAHLPEWFEAQAVRRTGAPSQPPLF